MKLGSILAATGFAVGVLAVSAGATVNLPVFSTGSNGSTLITAGSVDPHYTVSGPSGGPSTFVATPRPSAWLANDANSQWDSPQVKGTANDLPGTYTYTQTFTVSPLEIPSTGKIVLEYTADNSGVSIIFNGVTLPGTGTTGGNTAYTHFSGPFTINSGFLTGTNTLQFVVSNQGPTSTPEGLRVWVQEADISVVPEPSSVAAFGVAGLLLGGLLVRGRRMASNKA